MPTSPGSVAPPRWPLAALHAVLPSDSMRDAIVGDLHEELVRDAERVGAARAQAWYWRRAAGVVAHAAIDALCWQHWSSTAQSVEWPHAPAPSTAAPAPRPRAHHAGGTHVGLVLVALGVVVVGVVANTLLFTSVRGAPGVEAERSAVGSVLGAAAVVLSIACAVAAAMLLCLGPRWLRRRQRAGRAGYEERRA